jgi:hypothetical protein
VNFVTQIPSLAKDVKKIFKTTGYTPNVQKLQLNNKKVKFTFRIHKQAKNFIAEIGPEKR